MSWEVLFAAAAGALWLGAGVAWFPRSRPEDVLTCRLGPYWLRAPWLNSEHGRSGVAYLHDFDGQARRVIRGQSWARETQLELGHEHIYLRVASSYRSTVARGGRCLLAIEFFDAASRHPKSEAFCVQYTAQRTDGSLDVHVESSSHRFARSGRWKSAYFDLPGFAPRGEQPAGQPRPGAGADFRIHAGSARLTELAARGDANLDLTVRRATIVVLPAVWTGSLSET